MKLVKDNINEKLKSNEKISDEEAEKAFKTIISWIGEDPTREGLIETPKRVIKSFQEHFAGYFQDPEEILLKTLLMKE